MYTVYGVNISSEIRLPDLRSSQTHADAEVVIAEIVPERVLEEMTSPERFERKGCVVHMSPDASLYEWTGLARGLVRHGREILLDPEPGTDPEDLAPLVVGALLGILLSHRGALVLHGSFVMVGGKGFGFLGDKGMGKSTLAAYLTMLGHELVTDDLLPLVATGEKIVTKAGYPRIRLWPDSLEKMGLGRDIAEESSRLVPKAALKPERFRASEEIPLGSLFILDEGESVEIERLQQKDSLIELIRNTYLNRYLGATRKTEENFRRCNEVVREVPVFRLKRPADYSFLPSVARILEDLEVGGTERVAD
ncbi:MAG: hypothetical protein IPM63_03380 [Acidobacteriota bacterium]|nr:MAG: hypothetical protein IPM63_03380 [Acidobacteriota bacterium]